MSHSQHGATPHQSSSVSARYGVQRRPLGLVGLAIGGGATFSTTLAGLVADDLGVSAAFLSLAAVGLIATVLVGTIMPETRALVPG